MSKKKLLIIIGVVVVVAVLVIANLTMNTSKAAKVQADVVTTREIVERVSASGRVQPQTKVNITSEVNGEIIGLYVREGDRVEAGKLLVLLDTVQVASDVQQARYALSEIKARLDGAKTTLDQAEEEFRRQEKLMEKDLTSETIYKNARYAHLNAKATYEAMLAQEQQAQSRLEKQLDYLQKCRITAPMPGVITFLDVEVGEIAAAQTAFTQGKTLMTISNLDVFEVEVEVDETEIVKVEQGQPVDIEIDAFPDTVFKGGVVEIGNTAILATTSSSGMSTNFRVKVIFMDVNKKVRPGMSATVDIETARRDNALSVPYSAVVVRSLDRDSLEHSRAGQGEGEPAAGSTSGVMAATAAESSAAGESGREAREEVRGVYVIRNGAAEFVAIQTGIADQKFIEVTSGLAEKDSVVAGPYRVLRTINPGDAVAPEAAVPMNEGE
ncbi:MAG TPA: efflux RND transporter periplasmic adaptor subunit [candidate division Zixibacteria bacterium]|nr:efflux RND transporter periplasmic adaptor subunit [candidate division Zixibacteria bacterium]MDD4918914.1 efflux RND transporter periplasmic adaptor subunit [candidate division Zixibacteria bacterium]HOD66618.1 efflux RND transporter periplasmic adaptor subunit [candidate division Zixibacteria bacterium]HPM35941.1 efflux RND transporter periplasmic adaptor subunit [candidate division Zixibacteria bacterium]